MFWSITFEPYIRKSKWLSFLESTGHSLSYETNLTIFSQNVVFTEYRKVGKHRPRWQAEKRFWEVFILISLLLSPLRQFYDAQKGLFPSPPPPNMEYITISFKSV